MAPRPRDLWQERGRQGEGSRLLGGFPGLRGPRGGDGDPSLPDPSPGREVREELEFRESPEELGTDTGSSPADEEPAEPPEPLSDVAPGPPVQADGETGMGAHLPMVESFSDPLPAPDLEPPAIVEELPEPEPERTAVEEDEDSLERKISSFEEELASQCPLCGTSTVHQQRTPAGRNYYQCSNRQCSFVSWGRPHHVPAPGARTLSWWKSPKQVKGNCSDAHGPPADTPARCLLLQGNTPWRNFPPSRAPRPVAIGG